MAATYPAQPARRRGSFVLPLLLIGLGVVFLMRNYGLLPPNFWQTLAHLWPLVLVLIGAELLVSGRVGWLGQLAILAIVLVLGVGAIAAFNLVGTLTTGPTGTASIDQPLQGASRAKVHLNFGAGHFRLGALEPGGNRLIAGSFDGPGASSLQPRYAVRDGVGDFAYALKGDGLRWMPWPMLGGGAAMSMDINLSPDVPLELDTQLGGSDGQLDLSQLKVTNLDLQTGASNTSLRLPQSAGITSARVRSGAASIDIEVPPGVGAQIDYRGGLGNLDVDSGRFAPIASDASSRRFGPDAFKGMRRYRSADYDTAANKVDLVVESGASNITIR